MKYIFFKFISNLPSLACILLAGYLAINGVEGWGWFLFLAFLLFTTINIKDD